MKRILIFALITLLLFTSLFSCADNQSKETEDKSSESVTETEKKNDRLPAQTVSGEGFELLLSEDQKFYTLKSKGTCVDEKITVPAEWNGIPIKAIADGAFEGCEGVTEIVISEGITEIGKNAFAFSKDLQKITLPNTVPAIPERICYSCPKLENVTFGNAITAIGDSAFENCVALKSIALGDSVKTVSAAAFYNCAALSEITLGNAIEQIKHSAFDKTAYTENTQNWQDKLLYNGKYLLKVAPDKTGELTVKEGTLLIADHAAKKTAITSVKFPSSIKFIGAASFTACLGLTKIELPEGTVAIYDEAFSSCDGITEVKLPDSLTTMGELAFYHCSSLREIIIPKGITEIADQAFNECASVKNIVFHDNITKIGVYSFANCSSVVKINFPSSLKVINESAFYKCYNLVSITLPRSLYKINNYAFQHCNKLLDIKNESTINITANSKDKTNGYVGTYALEIHKGESKIKEIDDYLFYTFGGTNYLIGYVGADTSLTLPESMNGESYTIYKYAFCYNTKFEKISIPTGATAINGYAFTSCHGLTELTFGKNITTVAKNAMSDCPEFKKLTFLGTETEFNSININSTNANLLNAQIIYNS